MFFINNKISYDPCNASLSSISNEESSDVKLDYLESIALDLLISKKNQLVKYDEFFSNWRSSEVTDNSLSRVVSMLRKKMKQAGLTDSVIINTAKKGYTLVAQVEKSDGQGAKVSSINPSLDKLNLQSTFSNKKPVVTFIIVAHFLMLIVTLIFISNGNDISVKVRETSNIELLSNKDIKIELAYNNWLDQIAYTKKSIGNDYWEIEILNRYDGKKLNIRKKDHSLNKATWLGPNELVYRQYNERECSIQKALISSDGIPPETIKLFPCNPNSYASALASFGKNKLLITDSLFNDTSARLFIGDLQTGLVKEVEIDNGGGAGFYNVITTANTDIVALLSSPDGVKFHIQLVDPSNRWEEIWKIELETINFSVGWDGSSLSFKNDKGGISVVDFHSGEEINRVNIPTLAPTYNISTAKNGIMLTSGELFSQDIIYLDDSHDKVINLTAGTHAINKNAILSGEETLIFYISNRTGLNQVWSYSILSNKSKQISKFTVAKKIQKLALNPNNQMLALQVGNNVELYSLENMINKLATVNGINPEFFSDLLLYSDNDNVKSLSLESLQPADFGIKGAELVKHYNSELYYSKKLLPGIWRYNKNKDDSLVLKLTSSAYYWFVGDDKILFRNDIGNYFQFELQSRELSEFKKENCDSPIALTKKICISALRGGSENRLFILEWG